MPAIQKRGPNTYRVTVSMGYDINNKKIAQRKTFTLDPDLTLKQAEKEILRLATIFEDEVKSGQHVSANLTFKQFADQWERDYGEKQLEATTLASYKGELRTKILPALGHIKLKDLKPLHLIRFLDYLTKSGSRVDGKPGGYSTRVIKYQHSIISSILQAAVHWQIINDNVARRVQPPKGDDKPKGDNYLDELDTGMLLKYILKTEPLEYQAMAMVTVYSGLRKGEVLGLRWEDISFEDNTIWVNKAFARANKKEFIKSTKNKSSKRIVALPETVMQLLKKLKAESEGPRVFPFCYSTPTHWFKRVKSRFNEEHDEKLPEDLTFHGLRHTSASLLIAQGTDLRSVASRLGHSDMTTTARTYAHAIKSRDVAAADALEKIIGLEV